jgi:hypothetical protein
MNTPENVDTIRWSDWLQDHSFTDLLGIQTGSEHPFDQIVWSPGEPDRLAAWTLYTELRTRITTQPLAYRAGDEATALESVYGLFEISRAVIEEHPGCTTLLHSRFAFSTCGCDRLPRSGTD